MTYEEFEWELRAWLSKETEMIRQTLPYARETKTQRDISLHGGFIPKIVSNVRNKWWLLTRNYKAYADDPGKHPGFLSGRRAKGQGGFNLEKTSTGWKLWIDPIKVYYAQFVNMPNKKTADFWSKLVVSRFENDFLDFIKGIDPNATIE